MEKINGNSFFLSILNFGIPLVSTNNDAMAVITVERLGILSVGHVSTYNSRSNYV